MTNNNNDSKEEEKNVTLRVRACEKITKRNNLKIGSPYVQIYAGTPLKVALIKANAPVNQICKKALQDYINNKGVEIDEYDQYANKDLVIKVRCPYCSHIQLTASIKMVRCKKCKQNFRLYLKGGFSRIVGIEKGNRALLLSRVSKINNKGGFFA
jgi:ribosomal protein S27E